MELASMFIYEAWTEEHVYIVVAHNEDRVRVLVRFHDGLDESVEPQIKKLGVVTADVCDDVYPGVCCKMPRP